MSKTGGIMGKRESEFIKLLEGADIEREKAFNEFIDGAACAISCMCDERSDISKKRLLRCLEVDKKLGNLSGELLRTTFEAYDDEPMQDFLGGIRRSLKGATEKQRIVDLSDMDIGEALANEPYISVCDPSVGSGSTLINCAGLMRDQGYDPSVSCLMTGMDEDDISVKISYIQLSVLGLAACLYNIKEATEDVEDDRCWYTPAMTMEPWTERIRQIQDEGGL